MEPSYGRLRPFYAVLWCNIGKTAKNYFRRFEEGHTLAEKYIDFQGSSDTKQGRFE
jgi:hypothetical protein